jgi:thiol-disulfide isomerase/thioredoxin
MIKAIILTLLLGCNPSVVSISDDTTEPEVSENTSNIHGGSPVPEEWEDCGGHIGDHPCNFALVDQYGDTFTLYDNYNTVIVLDFSTMWCSVCNNIAHDAQEFMDDYGSQDFLWVTVLIEDSVGESPGEKGAQDWADLYGIVDAAVVAGDRSLIDLTAESGWPVTAWPTIVILDRSMIVKYGINGWNEETTRSWVESEL